MKSTLLILLLLTLFFTLSNDLSNAQNFKLGFDLKPQQIRISDQGGNGILGGEGVPISFHAIAGVPLSKTISLRFEAGNTLHIDFNGWEFGISGNYNFFSPLYLSAGILHHSNEGGSGSISWSTSYASILMLFGGLGIELSRITSIEVGYYIPTSKKIIGSYRLFTGNYQFFSMKLET
jgi:hypothetical protein